MKIEFKVRPVTRFIVTKYTEQDPDEHGYVSASSEILGTYENKDQAHAAKEAFEETFTGHKEKYVIVQNNFDVETKAYYAYSKEEAEKMKHELSKDRSGYDWRIYKA